MTRLLFAALASWLSLPATAATVAVLPLDMGAGSAEYDGLGTALSGMLTTDLARAPTLQLVERSRLDALLDEMALVAGGFIDATTAQELGKGVGADLVVLGSYSVVGEQFLMDARLVEVGTGRVVEASDASGTVDGFIAVEDALVASLLQQLEVTPPARRPPPTASFDAFAAYGEGVALQERGELGPAREAFEAALVSDPQFVAAKGALGGLILALEAERAARSAGLQDDLSRRQQRILDAVPDERTRAPTFDDDRESVAGLGMRMLVLREQGRDCQRYEEMRHYAERVGWQIAYPKGGWEPLVGEMMKLAVAQEYAPRAQDDPQGHRSVEHEVQSGPSQMFGGLDALLYRFPSDVELALGSDGLLGAMGRCLTLPEQRAAIGEIRAILPGAEIRVSVGDALHPGVTLDELLALTQAQKVLTAGEQWERARVSNYGLSEQTGLAALRAVAALDPAGVDLERPVCASLVSTYTAWAAAMSISLDDPRKEDGHLLRYAVLPVIAVLADMGCVAGVPGRFSTAEEVHVYLSSIGQIARPEYAAACAEPLAQLAAMSDRRHLDEAGGEPSMEAYFIRNALSIYHAEVVPRLCVTVPW
jgi:TolB-like protein